MPVIGHGVDIVETARIARMLSEHGTRFLDRCFTPAEQAYAADSRRRDEHLAARFAAKEAVLKALGNELPGGMSWTEIEIVKEPSGKPIVRLSGQAARIAASLGINRWHVSMSHADSHAIASAVAES